jgi:hypothetical protein
LAIARLGIDSSRKKESSGDIRVPAIDPGADAWRNGKVIQIENSTCRPHQH